MRVISAGDGYRYLLKSVAAADGARNLGTPLTRYYAATGTPPGRWLGSAAIDLGDENMRLAIGGVVREEQLARLFGAGRDSLTDKPLGRPYANYNTRDELPGKRRRAVAGYDYTFSLPKSASVLWALSDASTQSAIAAAHHAAVADVLRLIEREVAATRVGAVGADGGAVAQVPVTGVVAACFDHYDSRTGDPHLHTHVVVSNKVRATADGKWRALDGRPVHAATVALSEHYHAILADKLSDALGVGWEQRSRGRDRNPAWDIHGVPDGLLAEFSQRSHQIDAAKDDLIAAYVAEHGRQPSRRTVLKLRQQATLQTRPDKDVRPLSELTAQWRTRATTVLGSDATDWTRNLLATHNRAVEPLRAEGLDTAAIDAAAHAVLQTVGEKRSTWRHWNLWAEATRQTMGLRFTNTADREAVVGRVVAAAEARSVRLTPPEAAPTPAQLRRADGTSMLRPRHATVFTSNELLGAETRLRDLANDTTAPAIDNTTVEQLLHQADRPRARAGKRPRVGTDQADASGRIVTSARRLDVLVGPAGAGKTTTMRTLRSVWEQEHGSGSVIGLAPSAAAAEALADDLGIGTENTAKWCWEHDHGRWNLHPGQLVIVDEATLAGTHTLDTLASHAADVGAKVLLVGDPHQLDAVDAGGAFNLLVADRRVVGDLTELADVRRFKHDWEKTASLRLRTGDTDVLETYEAHGRIRGGELADMLDATYHAWQHDTAAGRWSLMIAESRDTVTELNRRARTDRIASGHVAADREVDLADGSHASAGDLIVTRRNNRHLAVARGWVKNGDHWRVTRTHADGSLTVRRTGRRIGATVKLPADYVAEHVDLGYATTVHRAQGATVDTAHVLVTSQMTREAYYVAMTRARDTNTSYVATDQPGLETHQTDPDAEATARAVLAGVLHHVGAEPSAHQTAEAEADRYGSIAQLAAEYDTLANQAQRPRWQHALTRAGLSELQVDAVLASDSYGALATLLRRAEADGHNPDGLLHHAVQAHELETVDDLAAVLHHRVRLTADQPGGRPIRRTQRQLIVGLIPETTGPMTDEMSQALEERKRLIERRADDLVEEALRNRSRWIQSLGAPPADTLHRHQWIQHARTLAAYRDRYQITTDRPLGPEPASIAQRIDAARARAAMHHAQQTSAASRAQLGRTAPHIPPPTL